MGSVAPNDLREIKLTEENKKFKSTSSMIEEKAFSLFDEARQKEGQFWTSVFTTSSGRLVLRSKILENALYSQNLYRIEEVMVPEFSNESK